MPMPGRQLAERRRGSSAGAGFDLDQDRAFADLGAELDQHFLDRTRHGGRDVHRRLVGFEGSNRIVNLDAVANLDVQLDDRHFREVADIRHLDLDHATAGGGAAAGAAATGAGAGAAACGAGAAAAAPLSTLISTVPSPTLEPSWTSTSLTTPSTVEGTSIVALSDSRVAIASSTLMLSPTLTYSSMTGTSEKSPISGTLTSMIWLMLSLPD